MCQSDHLSAQSLEEERFSLLLFGCTFVRAIRNRYLLNRYFLFRLLDIFHPCNSTHGRMRHCTAVPRHKVLMNSNIHSCFCVYCESSSISSNGVDIGTRCLTIARASSSQSSGGTAKKPSWPVSGTKGNASGLSNTNPYGPTNHGLACSATQSTSVTAPTMPPRSNS